MTNFTIIRTGGTMRRTLTFAPLVLALSACTAQSVKPTQTLAPNEGVLVTTVECSIFDDPFKIELYRTGSSSKGYFAGVKAAGSTACERQKRVLRTISLPAGSYFIGKIGYQTFVDIPESQAVAFDIKARKLNYIGDIRIVSAPGARASTTIVDARVIDNEKSALVEISTDYPWLQEKYEWVKSLARDPRRP